MREIASLPDRITIRPLLCLVRQETPLYIKFETYKSGLDHLGELLNFVTLIWYTEGADYMRKTGALLLYLGIPEIREV